jgi:hypothetical protein
MKFPKWLARTAIILAVLSSGTGFAAEEPAPDPKQQRLEELQRRRFELFEVYQRAKSIADSLKKMDAIEGEVRKLDEEEKKILGDQTRELEKLPKQKPYQMPAGPAE